MVHALTFTAVAVVVVVLLLLLLLLLLAASPVELYELVRTLNSRFKVNFLLGGCCLDVPSRPSS